jgi:hypothetical protein
MNFEINENKLQKIVFKYVDNKNYVIKETDDDYYFLENEGDEYAQIRVRKNDMLCFIYNELTEEIKSFFSIEYPMVKDVLTRYVENTLNIEVSNTARIFLSRSMIVENTLN